MRQFRKSVFVEPLDVFTNHAIGSMLTTEDHFHDGKLDVDGVERKVWEFSEKEKMKLAGLLFWDDTRFNLWELASRGKRLQRITKDREDRLKRDVRIAS